jgi:hypothetical protein
MKHEHGRRFIGSMDARSGLVDTNLVDEGESEIGNRRIMSMSTSTPIIGNGVWSVATAWVVTSGLTEGYE